VPPLSFLCSDAYWQGYQPGSLGKGQPSSVANHVGFRCVRRDAGLTPRRRGLPADVPVAPPRADPVDWSS
jgi:hypothetical protein